LLDAETCRLCPPVPAPLAKLQKHYRFHMTARADSVGQLTRPLQHILQHIKVPRGVQISVDVDAVSLM
jgi:primosomal protein N'